MTTFKFEKLSLIQRDRPIIQGCFGDENIGNKPSWIECEYLRGGLKGNCGSLSNVGKLDMTK